MKTPLPFQARAVILAAILPLIPCAASESPSLLLQKGIYAEEIERNLDSAIKIYEQIAGEAASNRAVVAQAQYRLAVCYEKQGKKQQAIKLLNELVQQIPSAGEISEKSKVLLTELGGNALANPAARLISLPLETNWFMSVSPNGRYVAYQPKDTNDLAVSDVVAGKTWTLVKGSEDRQPQSAWISPDNQRIAYQLAMTSVIMSNVDGSDAKTVYKCDEPKENCWVHAWAPDGNHLILRLWDPREKPRPNKSSVYSLDLKTGATRLFVRYSGNAGSISPDGSSAITVTKTYPRRIEIRSLIQDEPQVLLDREAGDFFGWFAGGTKVLYSKRRLEGVELFTATIEGGHTVGAPEHIWTIPGEARPEGIGEDGSVYYSAPRDTSEALLVGSDRLWVIEGLLNRKVPVASLFAEIPPEEILGPDHSIQDRKYGLGFKLPNDWAISGTRRRDREQSGIWFNLPASPKGFVSAWYAPTEKASGGPWTPSGKKPTTASGIDSWLRECARLKVVQTHEQEHIDDYTNRPESFVSRTIGGHPALSWSADFTRGEKKWIECHTMIAGKEIGADFRLRCPADDINAIKPAFENMIETVHLP